MQYLMVLLLMAGVIVLMLGALAGVSYGMGAYLHSRAGRADGPDRCAQCQADGGCRQLTWASTVVSVETPPLTPGELSARQGEQH